MIGIAHAGTNGTARSDQQIVELTNCLQSRGRVIYRSLPSTSILALDAGPRRAWRGDSRQEERRSTGNGCKYHRAP